MLEECINAQQAVINDFDKRVWELKEEEALQENESYSLSKRSFDEQMMTEAASISKQLQFANEEMELLYKMQNQDGHLISHDAAELGAAVETDNGTFFVSVSIEHFSVDGKDFIGLSTKSPLFLRMKGKRKGESFAFNDTIYTIRDIF